MSLVVFEAMKDYWRWGESMESTTAGLNREGECIIATSCLQLKMAITGVLDTPGVIG